MFIVNLRVTKLLFYHWTFEYDVITLSRRLVSMKGRGCVLCRSTWLFPYEEEVIGDYQCGFRRNRSTTDHIFCIRQTREKKWEYNEVVHQLFIDFKKAYDSVRREVLCNILIEFGFPQELVRLIKCV